MTETDGYDPQPFFEALRMVQGYLAELRHIDTGMSYVESELPGWVEEYAVRSTPFADPEFVDVNFGRTFPFTKTYVVRKDSLDPFDGTFNDTHGERIRARVAELEREAEAWAAANIETIVETVRPFTWPRGWVYDSHCIQRVERMHELLDDDVRRDFGLLQGTLGQWEGEAARNFRSHYYNPFQDTLDSQKDMLGALMAGIATAKVIAESSQQSLMNAVIATREALHDQLQVAQREAKLDRLQSQQEALVMVSGSVRSLSALVARGSVWGAALAAVSDGAQLAADAVPSRASTSFSIQGATAEDLLNSLSEGIGRIRANDIDQHSRLEEELDHALRRIDHLRGGADGDYGRLIPIRPDLVDGVDADTFYLP